MRSQRLKFDVPRKKDSADTFMYALRGVAELTGTHCNTLQDGERRERTQTSVGRKTTLLRPIRRSHTHPLFAPHRAMHAIARGIPLGSRSSFAQHTVPTYNCASCGGSAARLPPPGHCKSGRRTLPDALQRHSVAIGVKLAHLVHLPLLAEELPTERFRVLEVLRHVDHQPLH